jgi:glycosyltransferase involved in cell wall biosynthesis
MEYVVDVLMPVYNQEKFLDQGINSIISQKTDFKFRLLVGDDCSCDNSQQIIARYADLYPDIVFPFFRKKNLGAVENSKLLRGDAKAKYIGICEGDDYWVSNLKLQAQVDALERDAGLVGCAHNVDVLVSADLHPSPLNVSSLQRLQLNATGFHTPCHACSFVYRNIFHTFPAWMTQTPAVDLTLMSFLLTSGDFLILPETMSVYRANVGEWGTKGRTKQVKGIIDTIDLMLSAPEFDGYDQFKFNLMWTKIDYIKEIMAAGEDVSTYQREISMMQYYEGVIDEMKEVYKDGKKLSSKITIPTLFDALQSKVYRSFKKSNKQNG